MNLSMLNNYYVIINIVGLVFCLINVAMYKFTKAGQIDGLLTIVALLGGSLGIVIGLLIFDRKIQKENVMSRVFIACLLVIQVIVLLMSKGYVGKVHNFNVIGFFKGHRYLLIYLIVINVLTFILFAVDKLKAIRHKNRIRIVTLLGLSFIGGAVGGLVSMYLFRHKTKKDYFTVGMPLIIVMHLFVLFFAMNVVK